MTDGPDFICVGMPKAGTGWLYDQLDGHPDFWMPPVKEVLYLMYENPPLPFAKHAGKTTKNPSTMERRISRKTLDRRDYQFLEHANAIRGKAMNLDAYAGLFAPKGDLLSGDVSPPYWILDAETVAAVAARFPQTKILLIVRDPVSRAWSRISMSYRGGEFKPKWLNNEAKFYDYIKTTRKLGQLFATKVVTRWKRHAPGLPFKTVLFDDIAKDPDAARREVLLFLGADPDKQIAVAADHNRKAEEEKLEMTDIARDVLVKYFADELRASAAMFGGAAREWPAKYGLA